MLRWCNRKTYAILLAALVLAWRADAQAPGEDLIAKAVAALQAGDTHSAEQLLREELRTHPNDGPALEILAVTLDQRARYQEADEFYKRALALAPSSPGFFNNYGNHLLAMGKIQAARAAFLKAISTAPTHVNALTQLARIALEQQQPAQAAKYLDRLPQTTAESPDVLILRMQTAYLMRQNDKADALLARLAQEAGQDPQRNFALGVALSSAGNYGKAEEFFGHALDADPNNFQAAYDLGLSAARAGHYERAKDALERALAQKPDDVDVMQDLAAVEVKLVHPNEALQLLVRARQLAPKRADVAASLARVAAEAGYFGDAAQAWEAYMSLAPHDDAGRREHAFAESAIGQNAQAALRDLEWYVEKHPTDATGWYELGTAQCATEPDKALASLNRAVKLKPDFVPAYVARGLLLYRQGNPSAALPDFEFAAAHDPGNATVLDRLGETYGALDRNADAVRVLRKAEQIDSSNPTVLLHLARALTKTGNQEEAAPIFARYRQAAAAKPEQPHPAGLVDFLSLSPQEQAARYRAGVERTVAAEPGNLDAQVRHLGLLLADGNTVEAAKTAAHIGTLRPNASQLDEAARELLASKQYGIAKELIETGRTHGTTSSELQLDLAIAASHVDGPEAGKSILAAIAPAERTGDYYLAQMVLSDGSQPGAGSEEALRNALQMKPTRADLYLEAGLGLIKQKRIPEARMLLDSAVEQVPDDPGIQLLRAAALEMDGKDAQQQLASIESRWPAWAACWIVHAMVSSAHQQQREATSQLDTAVALGASGNAVELCRSAISRQGGDDPGRMREQLTALLTLLFD